ncbi:MAG: methionine--tRNA ligase subunit beta [Candidatus Omnitrophica bacterium]|nr:methionine--tRNA ligase subunit beta [Candidatus Omnitrophota bacterium]
MDISYEEFKRLDLRTGKVVSVEDHPNADKLYLITVDLGTEQRKMVAGIKPWYQKEDLVGKNVIVLTNLAPKNIRGIESHGMILASLAGNQLAILTLDKDLPPGSPVS